MTYRAVASSGFGGGLNLRDKADVVREDQAIDCLNVEFTERGAVRQRDGWAIFASNMPTAADSLVPFYKVDGTRQLIAGCGTRVQAFDASGVVLGEASPLAGGPWTFARLGTPGSEVIYAGNGTDSLRKWNGTTWTQQQLTINGVLKTHGFSGGALCVQTSDNRLVVTGFVDPVNGSLVQFSNPGAPDVLETDGLNGRGRNFLQLTPGDGESIMGVVAWRELVFVFKNTKFFVFYGNSVASDGTPVFNYRVVDTGVGLASRRAVAVAREGVYFMSRQGVYRTNGGEPELVSSVIDPIWRGGTSLYFKSGPLNHALINQCVMTWHNERIYLAIPPANQTVSHRLLVYDTRFDWWSIWDIPCSALTSFQSQFRDELFFGIAGTTPPAIGFQQAGRTDDRFVTIPSRWRSGWFDYGNSAMKTIRESKVLGTGTCQMQLTKDFEDPASVTVDLAFGQFQEARVTSLLARTSARGSVFSTKFTNGAGSVGWAIHRLVHHLREQRVSSVRGTT